MEGPLLTLLISSQSVNKHGRHRRLLKDQDKMSNRNRGLSIDVSHKVSDHLAKQFQKRRFLEIDQSETRIV
jgi:hypothetical protein